MQVEKCENISNMINPEKQPRIISSKKRLDWDDPEIKVFQYKFKSPQNSEQEGEARIIYRTLDFFSKMGGDKLLHALSQKGIEQKDTIVHLTEFFPKGRWSNENINKDAWNGFDTEMIKVLADEGIVSGAKAIYIYTGKEEMKNFLNKSGFESVSEKDPRNSRFFKILDQKH